MATPTGVEENVDSRFIDYTIVGEFEELENAIEVALKEWMNEEVDNESKVIDYLQSKLVLSIRRFDKADDFIPLLFGLEHNTRYVLLSKNRSWTSLTMSERKYLLGALVTALNSSGCHNLPVFFVNSDIDTIESAPEIEGYCILKEGVDQSNPKFVHYESNLLTGINVRHALFFADGIREMFNHLVSGRRGREVLHSARSTSLRVQETFEYNSRLLHSSRLEEKARSQYSSMDEIENPETDAQDRVLCADFFRRSILSRSASGDETPLFHAFSKITINLCFDNANETDTNAFSDNKSFSNLVPSLQPFDSWTVRVGFDRNYNDQMDEIALDYEGKDDIKFAPPHRLSAVIRRLLGLYIFGKTAPVGLCMQDLRREEAGGRFEGSQKAQSIGLILSPEVRADLRELCGSVGVPLADREGMGTEARHQVQREWYLKLLFPGDTIGDELVQYAGPRKRFFFRPDYMGDKGEKIPFGSWLSMCSLCVGSLYGDLGDIATFWKLCTDSFRSCFDEGIEIADINLSYQSVNSVQGELLKGPQSDSERSSKGHRVRIWEHLLWRDVLRRKNSQDEVENLSSARLSMGCLNRVEVPDPQQLLSVQKLRMMIFCAAVKDEECVTAGLDVPLARRLPPTSDSISHQKAILNRLHDEGGDQNDENLLLRWQVANSAMVSDIRSFKAARAGASLEEFFSWYKLDSDEAFTDLASCVHPCTSSPSSSSESSPMSPDVALRMRKEVSILWNHLEACPAKDQKPIFRAETELEKSISYFETLTPVLFAAEMICAALETSIHIIVSEFSDILGVENTELLEPNSERCACGRERLCHKAICNILLRDVRNLRQDVALALSSIREDISSAEEYGEIQRSGVVSESISQSLLLALDALCENFDRVEEFQGKVRSLRSMFSVVAHSFNKHCATNESMREMLVALAFESSPSYAGRDCYCESLTEAPNCQEQSIGYTCRTKAESELLWCLGCYMHSEVSKDHVWHSDDARELGHPNAKTLFLSTSSTGSDRSNQSSDSLRADLNRRNHTARLSFVHIDC